MKIERKNTEQLDKSSIPFDALLLLLSRGQRGAEKSMEYLISGEVSPMHMRALVDLPYEVSITEKENRLILSLGSPENAGMNENLALRRYHSRLSLHSHSIIKDQGTTQSTFPSFTDALVTEWSDPTTPLILVQANGITQYGRPHFDPSTRKKSLSSVRELLLDYGVNRGIAISEAIHQSMPQLTYFFDLPLAEQASLQKQFAIDTRMIIQEAVWDDEKRIGKMMDYINLRKDYEH